MKTIRTVLCLVALAALLTCGASASTEGYTRDKDEDAAYKGTVTFADGKYAAAYDGATDGGQYLLLVTDKQVSGVANLLLNADHILYIDQKPASGSAVSFDFIPKNSSAGFVYLGGKFGGVQSPILLGTLESQGSTVSGTAVAWNDTDDAVYLLYPSTMADADIRAEWTSGTYGTAGNAVATGTKDEIAAATVDGKAMKSQAFSFEGVADGTYKLAIFKPGKYVPLIKAVTVSGGALDVGQVKLWLYGDVNYDGQVKSNDVLQINRYINGQQSMFDLGDDEAKSMRVSASDINSDQSVKSNDVLQINRYINGLTSMINNLK